MVLDLPLDLDPQPICTQKEPNVGKSNCIFHLKLRGVRLLILTNPMDKFFPWKYLVFSILIIFSGQIRIKVGPKIQTLGTSCGHKNLVSQNPFYGNCKSIRTTCGQNFSSIIAYVHELLPKLTSQKWAQVGHKTNKK